MDTREFKGLELAARAAIEQQGNRWFVPSASRPGGGNYVDYEGTICSCEDFELRQLPCKHIFAVRFVRERNRGKPLPVPATEPTTPDPLMLCPNGL